MSDIFENETEAERRLDRLEREVRRRQCDGVILQRGPAEPRIAPSSTGGLRADLLERMPAALAEDRPLMEMTIEWLDLLERKATRLESEVRQWEYDDRRRRRLAVVAAALLAAAWFPFAARFVKIERIVRDKVEAASAGESLVRSASANPDQADPSRTRTRRPSTTRRPSA